MGPHYMYMQQNINFQKSIKEESKPDSNAISSSVQPTTAINDRTTFFGLKIWAQYKSKEFKTPCTYMQGVSLIEMFCLNTIKQLFLFVEQLDHLEVGLP